MPPNTSKRETDESMRIAIAALYKAKYHNRSDLPLQGHGSVIAELTKATGAHRSIVQKVVNKCKTLLDNKKEYDARVTYERPDAQKIPPNSFEEHLVSVYKQRHSLHTTANIMNTMKEMDLGAQYNPDKDCISVSAVRRALNSMKHEKQKVKKVPQQSNNNAVWVRARYNLAAQLLVRFGLDLPSHVTEEGEIDPKIIDTVAIAAQGLNLSIHQIAWWDEIHIRQKIGEILEYIYVFSQNEKGLYDKNSPIQKKMLVSNIKGYLSNANSFTHNDDKT